MNQELLNIGAKLTSAYRSNLSPSILSKRNAKINPPKVPSGKLKVPGLSKLKTHPQFDVLRKGM